MIKMRSFKYHITLILIFLFYLGQANEPEVTKFFKGGEKNSLDSKHELNTPVEILSPKQGEVFKRGHLIEIRWTGGNPADEYALDLYNGKFHYRHIGELKNSGVYPWIIPTDVKQGKEFRFKLTNTNDFSEFTFGAIFTVKRKVPIVAWILPGGILVTGAVILLFSGDPDPDLSDLPGPIEPR